MKTIIQFSAILASLFWLFSCQKPEIPWAPTCLEVSEEALTLPAQGGGVTFTIKESCTTYSLETSWVYCNCTGSQEIIENGAKYNLYTYSVDVEPNKNYEEKRDTIVITSSSLGKYYIFVTQEAIKALIANPDKFELDSRSQRIEIGIKSNVKYDIHIDEASKSWISIVGTKGLESKTLVVDIAKNEEFYDRTGTILINDTENNLSQTITINQKQKSGLFVNENIFNVTNEAQTLDIRVTSNIDYEYTIDEACKGWISAVTTKGLTTDALQFNIKENTIFSKREGRITFKQKGGNLTQTITISQEEGPGFSLSKNNFDLSNDAQMIELEVNSNIDYEYIIDEACKDWISEATGTKATTTNKINFRIAQNNTFDKREGKITFKQKGGNLTEVVTISQEELAGLVIKTNRFDLSHEAQVIDVEVNTNVDFEYIIDEACKGWISAVTTKGLILNKVQFNIAKNEDLLKREGKITFKQKGGNLTEVVTISQEEGLFFNINQENINISAIGGSLSFDVESNIPVTVEVDAAAKDWLTPAIQTKVATSTQTYNFNVSANRTASSRTGKIIVSGNGRQKYVTVTQAQPVLVSGITLDKGHLRIIEGDTKVIKATVTPTNATFKDITWESSNPSVATVENGNIKAIASGTTTITAHCEGYSASCEVSVIREQDIDFSKEVTIQLTGIGTIITNGTVRHTRDYTIQNNSPADIELIDISTSNAIPINQKLASGASYTASLAFRFDIFPKITVRFKYKDQIHSVFLENYR